MAKALITGAGNGMGKDMAIILAEKGYDVVLVSRDEEKLKQTAKCIPTNAEIIPLDLSSRKNCMELYSRVRDIDVLINNAGYGLYGEFGTVSLKDEMNMLDLNVSAVHILTKLYLRDFIKRNKGYILNVASLAAFGSGPLMSTYYATKAYVYSLTMAIHEELRVKKSRVGVSVFCPGPVDTGFNGRAGVKFTLRPLDSRYASYRAIKGMFRKKSVIFPSFENRFTAVLCRLAPMKLVPMVCYRIQKKKNP